TSGVASGELVVSSAKRARIEVRPAGQRPPQGMSFEDPGRELAVEACHVLDRIAERQRPGDDRAGGGAADQIEPIAEVHLVLAEVLAKDLLDLLQKGDRDGASYAAAVE